jgi:phosphoribosylpyrophosphate synthetase
MVFTGNAHPKLAEDVVRHLNMRLGRATVGRFSDGEVNVEIMENVRGKDVFVLQSTCEPTNDSLMEIMLMVDALASCLGRPHHRRHSLFRLCPPGSPGAFGARADYRRVVADMLTVVGVKRVLTMDLHSDQIQGFFDIPGRQHLFHADSDGRYLEAELRQPDGGFARRRRCGARARRGQAAGMRVWRSSTSVAPSRMSPR